MAKGADQKGSGAGKGKGKPVKLTRKGNFDKFAQKKVNPKVEKKNDRRRERESLKREQDENESASPLLEKGDMRLNRFIALSGVCSRRQADELIQQGQIKVNGKVTNEMGLKIDPVKDAVIYAGKRLKINKFVYLLMNKPKNHITTMSDERGRRTVMELVEKYTKNRVVPVGRLDRNTTGLLLFTNDGDLTKKMTHPSNSVTKIYNARLDKDVSEDHLLAFKRGVELEDGVMKVDQTAYLEEGFNHVMIQVHSGRNRIVRRLFEHFGYEVETLDRVKLGPLNKKGLPRGKCRLLTEQEIGWLKMI